MSLPRVFVNEDLAMFGKTFVGTIDDGSGAIFGRSFLFEVFYIFFIEGQP